MEMDKVLDAVAEVLAKDLALAAAFTSRFPTDVTQARKELTEAVTARLGESALCRCDGKSQAHNKKTGQCLRCKKPFRTPEAVEKPGMKIIAADNFDRDHVADELIAENVPIFYAQKIVDYLNIRFSGDNAQRIYKVVLPDYKLHTVEP